MNESRPITHLPSPRPRVPGWARAALYLVAWFLLYAALASVGGVLAWGIGAAIPLAPTDPAGLAQAWITLAIICWLVLLGTVWLTAVFWRNLDRRPAQEFGFHPPQLWLRDTMAGLVLGAAAIFTVVLLGALAGWYRVRSPANAAEAARVLGAALLVLLPAAAVEEVAMRGYVLQTLARDYGRLVGTVVSAGIFAVLHLMNPGRSVAAFLGIFLAGLYFAAAFLLSGRLYLPIAAHFAWNWLLGPFFGLPVSGVQMPSVLHTTVAGPSAITGGSFGPEAGVLGWIALAINLPLLVLATRRR